LVTFPSDLPELNQIYLSDNALTSLHGLPLVIDALYRIEEGEEQFFLLDVGSNYLENLAGLPTIGSKHFLVTIDHLYDNLERLLLLEGNPLRSLYGVPSQWFYVFIYAFYYYKNQRDPSNQIDRPHWLSTSKGVSIVYKESDSSSKNFVQFLLSPAGATLLDACFQEITQYLVRHGDSEEAQIISFIETLQPKDAPPSWHLAFDALVEYYRLSPLELTHQYVAHLNSGKNSMSDEAIERLKHEGGGVERQLLENGLQNPLKDPVVQVIQDRLSVLLPNGSTFLL
jgi:hypothetical protein